MLQQWQKQVGHTGTNNPDHWLTSSSILSAVMDKRLSKKSYTLLAGTTKNEKTNVEHSTFNIQHSTSNEGIVRLDLIRLKY